MKTFEKEIKKKEVKKMRDWVKKYNDSENYQLYGIADNYVQCIDRDQVCDDTGKAYYKSYELVDIRTGEREVISAEQMEEFAKSW